MSKQRGSAFKGSKNGNARGNGASELIRKGPPKLFADTLAAVIETGAAVMLGGTRDGNTLVVTLMDGELREKQYCDDLDSWRQTLTDLAAWAKPDEGLPF